MFKKSPTTLAIKREIPVKMGLEPLVRTDLSSHCHSTKPTVHYSFPGPFPPRSLPQESRSFSATSLPDSHCLCSLPTETPVVVAFLYAAAWAFRNPGVLVTFTCKKCACTITVSTLNLCALQRPWTQIQKDTHAP